MAVLGVLQPSGSMTITMREYWSGNSFTVTLDEVVAMGKAVDSSCNTIFLNSYNDSNIYLVRVGHLDDPENLYFANFNQNSIGWNPTDIGRNNTLYNIKSDGTGLEPNGVAWNPSHTTWEGMSYDAYSEGSSERPLIIYTTANYENLYINGVLVDKNTGGGAGSGYIGNSLLSSKKMVGYNVPTSSAEGTYTESVNEASETPVANKPKIGNGFARIKFLREVSQVTFESLLKGTITDYISYNSGGSAPRNIIPDYFNDYLLSDKSLLWGWTQRRPLTYNDPYYSFASRSNESTSSFAIPIQRKTLLKFNLKLGLFNQPTQWCTGNIFAISIKNGVQTVETLASFGRNQYTYNIPELSTYYDFSWEGIKEDVDYIVFNGEDGEWRFKDITLFVN